MTTRKHKIAHPPGSGRLMTKKQKEEFRADAIEKIRALLALGPISSPAVAEKLGLNTSTAYAFMHHMHKELREIRKTGLRDAQNRELWELGEDLLLPTDEELLEQSFEPKRATVPARQVGMWRDGLVCALFGAPAQAQGAQA